MEYKQHMYMKHGEEVRDHILLLARRYVLLASIARLIGIWSIYGT